MTDCFIDEIPIHNTVRVSQSSTDSLSSPKVHPNIQHSFSHLTSDVAHSAETFCGTLQLVVPLASKRPPKLICVENDG